MTDLFEERESLRRIRDYARMRMVGPEAALLGILLRRITSAPVHVMIPPIVGSAKQPNLVVVTVGPSGIGKTASDDVAEDYYPSNVPTYPLGTAEGTCQAFNPDEDGRPQQNQIIFTSSEIDTWAALGERAGSMTIPVLRQMVTGDMIGQKNSSKDRTRIVAKGTYRAGLSLSAQPGSHGARVLFADAPGGFPQRCLFGMATDPDAPDEPPTGIEPYQPDQQPDFTPNAGDCYEVPFPDVAVAEIRDHRLRTLRADPTIEPLDGHRYLTRAKVSVGLMLIEGRERVSEDDWRIAGRIMSLSDKTRAHLIAATKDADRAANRAKAHAIADRDDIVSDRKLERAKQAIVRKLGRSGEVPTRELRSALKADLRDNFDAAMSELADDRHIFAIEVEGGRRYRLTPEVHAGTEVHAPKPQVTTREPKYPQVPTATVTDIDTRRSHVIYEPTLSGAKWFANHIAGLVADGHTIAESFAVYAAGEAAGYKRTLIEQAVAAHPDVHVVDRKGGTATWSIIPGYVPPKYISDAAWLDNFINQQTADTIDPNDVKAACQADGREWSGIRKAAGRSPRITSEPAHGEARTERIWRIVDPDDAEDAS